jgi:DNA (cytosine-5)-methyltransferase 1
LSQTQKNKAVKARAEEPAGSQVNIAANDNIPATGVAGEPLTFISMFSGIEAASVAFGPLGWKAVAFAEIEKFPSAVLAHHYPDVRNVGDMTAHDWVQYRHKVDIVCGGPPCQAFSVAGLRNSMQDARGNLSLSYMRALHAIDPRNAIVENVLGWLNTPDNAFGCFLAGIVGADDAIVPSTKPADGKSDAHWKWSKKAGRHTLSWPHAGMVSGPQGRAAWRIQDAQFHGLAQRRRRVLLVADFGRGADPAAVLFERVGMQGNPAPSREAWKDIAPTISARTKGGGGLGTDFDLDGGLDESAMPVGYAPEIARCDATREGSSQDYETTTMVAVSVTGDVSHTLKAEGADASEDGAGRGTPIVTSYPVAGDGAVYDEGDTTAPLTTGTDPSANVIAFSSKDYGGDASLDLSPTLRAGGHTGSHANAGVMPAIALSVALRGREGGGTAELGGEQAGTQRASSGGGDKPHVLTSAVRRLTPTECERLMGFPDGYTNIPWRGKPTSPDGPRYKALGNSWAVPKFAWLGARIQKFMPATATQKDAA